MWSPSPIICMLSWGTPKHGTWPLHHQVLKNRMEKLPTTLPLHCLTKPHLNIWVQLVVTLTFDAQIHSQIQMQYLAEIHSLGPTYFRGGQQYLLEVADWPANRDAVEGGETAVSVSPQLHWLDTGLKAISLDCMENHIFWSIWFPSIEWYCLVKPESWTRHRDVMGPVPWATRSCGGWAWCQGATRPGSWATRSYGDCILILSSARWDETESCRGCCTGTWLGVQLTGIHCSNSGDRTSQPRGPGLHGPRDQTRGDHLQSWWEDRSQAGLLHN